MSGRRGWCIGDKRRQRRKAGCWQLYVCIYPTTSANLWHCIIDIASLQDRTTGTFAGDAYGEQDTRFLYAALNALSLLHSTQLIDLPLAVQYIQSCANFDGGYGVSPGAESHSGQIFACVAALSIAGALDTIDGDKLGAWLSERQVDGGGFNGRPEKLEDACYSWWVGASLAALGKLHWIEKKKLGKFILECQVGDLMIYDITHFTNSKQDPENGGFADRPGDVVDVFHTNFSISGLALIGWEKVEEVDPA